MKQASSQRFLFIDIMRGIAALWMIETHVLNEFIKPEYREGWFYDALNISNGFVSVGFIFCAGVGFMIAAGRKRDEYQSFAPSLWLYLRRLLYILTAAYLLDTPSMALRHFMEATPDEMAIFYRCDVLHSIVFSSLTALAIALLPISMKTMRGLFVAITILFFFAAAPIWQTEIYTLLPNPYMTLFAPVPISPFPFVPWGGYFFGGAALAGYFFEAKDKQRFAIIISSVTLFLCFFLFTLKNTGLSAFDGKKWWTMAPEYFLFRLSGASLFFSLLFLGERWFTGRFADIVRRCGQESLFIYILQGVLIFTVMRDWSLRFIIERQQEPSGIIVLTLAVTAICVIGALLWNLVKRHKPQQAKYLLWTFGTAVMAWFFFAPKNPELIKLWFFPEAK